ncbi:MAG: hypothetical protein Kow0025_14900 [Thermodesulfovibrionales bacterium]
MEKIALRGVTKRYDGVEAVKDLSLGVGEGETLVLIGTSGCGKTTTMKMINRLVEPSEGEIEVDGRSVFDLPPVELRRHIGYVIQSVGLFPHMTVGRNVGIVPELLKWDKKRAAARVDEMMGMVGLDPGTYRERYPAELSGGQQQRVGVARALAADPPVVLMDEPFGALDPITREQLQNEFLALLKRMKKTVIFVTHDIFEAVKMGDRLAIMDRGRLVQAGTPPEIVREPATEFVADFLGKHRFQLRLLLMRLGDIREAAQGAEEAGDQGRPALWEGGSVLDALEYFRKHGADYAPLRDGEGRPAGRVTLDGVGRKVAEALTS